MADKPLGASAPPQQQGGEQEAGDCGDEALQRAYWLGWRNSAAWADRKDLWADSGSQAYLQERDDDLNTLTAALRSKQPAANNSSNELEGNKDK